MSKLLGFNILKETGEKEDLFFGGTHFQTSLKILFHKGDEYQKVVQAFFREEKLWIEVKFPNVSESVFIKRCDLGDKAYLTTQEEFDKFIPRYLGSMYPAEEWFNQLSIFSLEACINGNDFWYYTISQESSVFHIAEDEGGNSDILQGLEEDFFEADFSDSYDNEEVENFVKNSKKGRREPFYKGSVAYRRRGKFQKPQRGFSERLISH